MTQSLVRNSPGRNSFHQIGSAFSLPTYSISLLTPAGTLTATCATFPISTWSKVCADVTAVSKFQCFKSHGTEDPLDRRPHPELASTIQALSSCHESLDFDIS